MGQGTRLTPKSACWSPIVHLDLMFHEWQEGPANALAIEADEES